MPLQWRAAQGILSTLHSKPGYFGMLTSTKVLRQVFEEVGSCCTYSTLPYCSLYSIFTSRVFRSDDDLETFQATALPLIGTQSAVNYQTALRYSRTPLQISAICRQVHASLTGLKARQTDEIDTHRLHEVWNHLGLAWDDLEGLRNFPTTDMFQPHELERFIGGWQVREFLIFHAGEPIYCSNLD